MLLCNDSIVVSHFFFDALTAAAAAAGAGCLSSSTTQRSHTMPTREAGMRGAAADTGLGGLASPRGRDRGKAEVRRRSPLPRRGLPADGDAVAEEEAEEDAEEEAGEEIVGPAAPAAAAPLLRVGLGNPPAGRRVGDRTPPLETRGTDQRCSVE